MARINLALYDIQFYFNRPGYKTYTWLISRSNYSRSEVLSSHTIWLYTTDDVHSYDMWTSEDVTFSQFVKFIKTRPTTKMYNDPVF